MVDEQQYVLGVPVSPSWGFGTSMRGSVRVRSAAGNEIVEVLFADGDGARGTWLASDFARLTQQLEEGMNLMRNLAASPAPTGQYSAKIGPWISVHTQKDGPFLTVRDGGGTHLCTLNQQRAVHVLRDWSAMDSLVQEAVATFRRMRK